MKPSIFRAIAVACSFFFAATSFAQNAAFSKRDRATVAHATRTIQPEKFQAFDFNRETLESKLANVPVQPYGLVLRAGGARIALPMPEGHTQEFRVWEAPVMAPELAARYPQIRTYKGLATDGSGSTVRFDLSPQGFRAQILTPTGAIHIDPYTRMDQQVVMSYHKRDYKAHDSTPFVEYEDASFRNRNFTPSATVAVVGEEMRNYRLAMACTGEYADYHGGTVVDALAAMVTTVNRVNGIYEREVSITMTLIANNDALIFLDGSNDPYNNGNAGAMLSQNQNTVNSTIGASNYDIGHVVSTGAGGIASLGSVCNNQNKARGVTGLDDPIGDFFDVDYVSHEMGHQFGGNHTFNSNDGSCAGNGNPGTAMEPGSGSTIMAYAGICGSHNLQSHSDDYFHSISFDEIMAYTTQDDGADCPTTTATGNTPPTVDAGNQGFTIPMETPFDLIPASFDDAEGDDITFCWESHDTGNFGHPDNPGNNDPIFRSFPPSEAAKRQLPQPVALVNGLSLRGEILPFSNRTMDWRCTVRDNLGGVSFDETSIPVTSSAGPFEVLSQNSSALYNTGEPVTVTWDVANTDAAPVNCQYVNILFSTDGGYTWPYIMAVNMPNNGSADVLFPNVETTDGRIRVEAADNIFFNINEDELGLTRTAIDAGIPYFDTPRHFIDVGSTTVSVWLHNYGQTSISNFDVSYTVDGGAAVTENVAGPIAAGDSMLHTFATPFEVTQNGVIELCATISGVTGDLQSSNNTVCREIPIVLSVNQQAENGLLLSDVFPNPASNQLQLRFGVDAGAVEVTLVDVLGNIALRSNFAGSHRNQTYPLDVSQLSQGTYLLMVRSGNLVATRRVVLVD